MADLYYEMFERWYKDKNAVVAAVLEIIFDKNVNGIVYGGCVRDFFEDNFNYDTGDVDAAIPFKNFGAIMQQFKYRGFEVKEMKVVEAKWSRYDVVFGDIEYQYRIRLATIPRGWQENNQNKEISLDLLLVKNDINPPFGSVDFTCNGLVMGMFGDKIKVRCGFQLDNAGITLPQVIDDIRNKIARVCQDNPLPHRIEKMKEKGWSIIFPSDNL